MLAINHIVLAPHNGYSLPERMDKILGGWLMYRFWNTVFAHCKDWEQGWQVDDARMRRVEPVG